MIALYLDESVGADAEARIRRLLDDTAMRNVDFNGVHFVVRRGEGTWLDAEHYPDQGAVMRLLADVRRIVDGEDG